MSHVTCHMSGVRCQVSHFFWDKPVELVGGGSVINGAYNELSRLTLCSFLSMLIYNYKKRIFKKLLLAAHSCSFLQNDTVDEQDPQDYFLV